MPIVHRIKVFADGTLEFAVRGSYSDALLVRNIVNERKGVTLTEPKALAGVEGARGFRARGTQIDPLSLAKAVEMLRAAGIEVVETGETEEGV